MDPMQTMPSFDAMATKEYSPQDWLRYYKNIWIRNLIAKTVDVMNDTAMKAKKPDMIVNGDEGQPVKIGERLEYRKILIQDFLNVIEAIDKLIAIPADKLAETCWSEEALKVAADMMPPEQKAGDSCRTDDGMPGTLESDGKGGLVCKAIEAIARIVKKADQTEVARFTAGNATEMAAEVDKILAEKGIAKDDIEVQVMTEETAAKLDAMAAKGTGESPSEEAKT